VDEISLRFYCLFIEHKKLHNEVSFHSKDKLLLLQWVALKRVWLKIVYCFFTAGAKFLQSSFVIFVGEELTVFGLVRGGIWKKTWQPLV